MASCLGDRKQVQIAGSTGVFFFLLEGVGGGGEWKLPVYVRIVLVALFDFMTEEDWGE